MVQKIQAIRGMNDILPDQTLKWRTLEKILFHCMQQYGYQEIRFPLLEDTSLFKRSIGEVTDIVEKEMYSFSDFNGQNISLRPEGTAGCLRACLEHHLLYNQQQKLWYLGPMFRHERPQKGRYRQFTQFGIEALGISGVAIELELITISFRLLKLLKLPEHVVLQINTLGTRDERQKYRDILVEYLHNNIAKLDEDSKRRLSRNPLRILDSKNPEMVEILQNAPKLLPSLGMESRTHFQNLCSGLDALAIPYTINPLLVRGLDYYENTVFEWVAPKLAAQATICAGGSYSALVEQLGGGLVPAIGLALGVERLLLLLDLLAIDLTTPASLGLFLIAHGEAMMMQALIIAEKLRSMLPQWQIITNTMGGSIKSQFKKADKSGALFALVIGENEMQEGNLTVKNLRESGGKQLKFSVDGLVDYLASW